MKCSRFKKIKYLENTIAMNTRKLSGLEIFNLNASFYYCVIQKDKTYKIEFRKSGMGKKKLSTVLFSM